MLIAGELSISHTELTPGPRESFRGTCGPGCYFGVARDYTPTDCPAGKRKGERHTLRGDSVGTSQTLARRTNNRAMSFVNVAQSNFTVALRAFGDETVNPPLFFPLIAVLAVSDGLAPQHVRIVRFRTLRCLAKYEGQPGRARRHHRTGPRPRRVQPPS